MACALMILVD